MDEKNKFDLTQGGILSRLLLVAIPIMGTSLMQMAYNMTDMFWLGRLSSDAVAASGTGGMFLWLSAALMMIGRMGAEIGVSQNLGRRDEESARSYSQTALGISVILGVIYGAVILLFSTQLISFFQIQEAHVARDSASYLAICGIGIPFTFITGVLTGTFNGAGNSRLAFLANLVGLIVNVILDPIMIFTMNMGIDGAAWATIFSQISVSLVLLWAIKFVPSRPFEQYSLITKPDIEKSKQIFIWTFPIALENMFFTSLAMITTRIVTSFGSNAVTVQRVGSQIESLSWMIAGGFGSALTAFIGQNYGAGKWTRIRRAFTLSSIAMAVWGGLISIFLVTFGGTVYSFFITDSELILEMGAHYLKILACCQVFSCLESVASGAFRGTGQTLPPSVISISSNVIRVILAFVLSQTSLQLDGVWWAITIGAILRGGGMMIWYLITSRKQPREDVDPSLIPSL